MTQPNSTKRRPTCPGMNDSGTKTAMRVKEVAITAKVTCLAPRRLATSGLSPFSIRRWMFSSTTMASSTTRPMASSMASSVSVLRENPHAPIRMKEPMSETGIATKGTSVARKERRKSRITSTTRPSEMKSAIITSRIEAPAKCASSEPIMMSMPSGRVGLRRSISSRTPWEMARVFDWLCRRMAMPTASLPLVRTMVVSSATPGSTRATSPSRTG